MNADDAAVLDRVVLLVEPAQGSNAFAANGDDATDTPGRVAEAMRGWLDYRVADRGGYTTATLILRFVDGRQVSYGWSPPEPTTEHLEVALRNTKPAIQAAADGDGYTAIRRCLGPFTVYAAKEVGPPPWPWPKIGLWVNRERIHGLIGWRQTAYHASVTPTPAVADMVLTIGLAVGAGVWAKGRRRR